jgi:coproporphyrinogen III oxidase
MIAGNAREGGGGTSCMLEKGNVFERAGIGFSHVKGNKLPPGGSSRTLKRQAELGRQWESP